MENAGSHSDAPVPGAVGSNGYSVKPRLFAAIAAIIVAVDQITKLIAVDFLGAAYVPHPVLGNVLRLTLVYNPGAAFGIHLGQYSRWIFTALTIGALWLLWRLYRETPAGDTRRVVAISLVIGGAVGNLVDRLRSARGVTDFIDVGIGTTRWPTFNVADMAVSCGAILLAWVLWREDAALSAKKLAQQASEAANPTPSSTGSDTGPAGAPVQG
jgi:signal peptidase II